jgi:hypothetical protein
MKTTTRKTTTKTVKVYGWEGQGATAAEAKADAVAKIEQASEGYYLPKVVTWRGCTLFVYREPSNWAYTIECARPEDEGKVRLRGGSWRPEWHKEEACLRDGLRHLANITHIPGEEPTPPPFLVDEADRREYVRNAAWQNGYKAHKDTHPDADDDDCRAAASEAQYAYSRDAR